MAFVQIYKMTMSEEAGTIVPAKTGKKSSVSVEEKAELSADVSLPPEVLEKLYQSYAIKQKRDGLSSFLIASIMFDLWAIIVPQGQRLESLGEYDYYYRSDDNNCSFHAIQPHFGWLNVILLNQSLELYMYIWIISSSFSETTVHYRVLPPINFAH